MTDRPISRDLEPPLRIGICSRHPHRPTTRLRPTPHGNQRAVLRNRWRRRRKTRPNGRRRGMGAPRREPSPPNDSGAQAPVRSVSLGPKRADPCTPWCTPNPFPVSSGETRASSGQTHISTRIDVQNRIDNGLYLCVNTRIKMAGEQGNRTLPSPLARRRSGFEDRGGHQPSNLSRGLLDKNLHQSAPERNPGLACRLVC